MKLHSVKVKDVDHGPNLANKLEETSGKAFKDVSIYKEYNNHRIA